MTGKTGKWVRIPSGALVSLDKIESIEVMQDWNGCEVRAFTPEGGYYVLFSHANKAVCEEWRDSFAGEHLDVIEPIVLWRKCPECNGTGLMPSPDPDSNEPCPLCKGKREVTLEEYESAMREWGLTP